MYLYTYVLCENVDKSVIFILKIEIKESIIFFVYIYIYIIFVRVSIVIRFQQFMDMSSPYQIQSLSKWERSSV